MDHDTIEMLACFAFVLIFFIVIFAGVMLTMARENKS